MSDLTIHESAIKRIKHLRKTRGEENLMLRVTVDGGGCSGFQYILELSTEVKDDDRTYEGVVVSDEVSIPFMLGATVSFAEDLVGAEFKIDNPNAVQGCGCGTSFSV